MNIGNLERIGMWRRTMALLFLVSVFPGFMIQVRRRQNPSQVECTPSFQERTRLFQDVGTAILNCFEGSGQRPHRLCPTYRFDGSFIMRKR